MVQGCPAVEKADVPLDVVRQVIFLNNGGPIEQPTYKPVRYATKQEVIIGDNPVRLWWMDSEPPRMR